MNKFSISITLAILVSSLPLHGQHGCRRQAADLGITGEALVDGNRGCIMKMFGRLRSADFDMRDVGRRFEEFVQTYAINWSRIEDPILEGFFFRGVIEQTTHPDHLSLATKMLKGGKASLNYFAARTALLLRKFDGYRAKGVGQPFEAAVEDRRAFDIHMRTSRGIDFDSRTGEVRACRYGPAMLGLWREMGFNVSDEPISGFAFCNRMQPIADRIDNPYTERRAALHFGKLFPEEIWLGVGDQNVKHFLKLYHWASGDLWVHFRTADLLSIRPNVAGPSQHELVVREIKSTLYGKLDARTGVEQLITTAYHLHDLYPEVPVGVLELVILTDKPLSFEKHFLGPEIDGVHQLYNADRSSIQARLGGRVVPVTVRILPGII